MTPYSSQFSPLFYRSDYKVPEIEETQTRDNLATSPRGISEATFKDSGHAARRI